LNLFGEKSLGDGMDQQISDDSRICETLAETIRRRSEKGLLIKEVEILGELNEKVSGDPPGEGETLLRKALEENEDLKSVTCSDGTMCYYSGRWMSESYARILSRREGDPLPLMAETIRENSEKYPRPIPLDVFRNPPFEMTEEGIQASLQRMRAEGDYKDIATTTTSAGTLFLYSTLHLDPDHASMLAEWMDVGQAANP
jgi:hypothetical protein